MCIFFALTVSVSAQEATKTQSSNHSQNTTEQASAPLSLSSLLAQTVLFLYEDKTPPNSDKLVAGRILGTAFIVSIPVPEEPKKSIPFIVTAKHVIANQTRILGRYSMKTSGEFGFVQYNLEALRKSNDLWEYPEDEGVDIVVFRTLFFESTRAKAIPIDNIASKEDYKSDINPADRVIIPCLLANYPGTTQNYPIFRDGSIALITEEPIEFSWYFGSKKITTKQRMVFINSTLNEGFSGAPVFLWPVPRSTPKGQLIFGGKVWLLGVVHGFQPIPRQLIDADGEDVTLTITKPSKEPPDFLGRPRPPRNVAVFTKENPATGMIFPSWQILDILKSDAVKKRVQEISEEIKKSQT